MSEERHYIQYGDTVIEYELVYARRATLTISVEPDLRVSVIAPPQADRESIAATVRKRAPWILRQQRELAQYLPNLPPRQYISGETHRYLGRQYRLKVLAGEPESVKLTRGWFVITAVDRDNCEQVRELLEDWYQRQAERVFAERLRAMLPRFRPIGIVEAPPLRIKPLQARWGSCSSDGAITLNRRLIQADRPCIDYVIVHELCHVREHNHSKRFYLLLDRMLPDWRARREELNSIDTIQ
jgi:predicted metal-dependent hydrolase